MEQFHF